jgi:hypothetical protein
MVAGWRSKVAEWWTSQDPELLRFDFDSGLILDCFSMLNPKIDIKKDFEILFGVCRPLKDENLPLMPFWSLTGVL